jgi:hypothetical protein
VGAGDACWANAGFNTFPPPPLHPLDVGCFCWFAHCGLFEVAFHVRLAGRPWPGRERGIAKVLYTLVLAMNLKIAHEWQHRTIVMCFCVAGSASEFYVLASLVSRIEAHRLPVPSFT